MPWHSFHHSIINKKTWHPGRFDNKLRVQRDERNAQQEEQRKLNRAQAAEQEMRVTQMRARAKAQQEGVEFDEAAYVPPATVPSQEQVGAAASASAGPAKRRKKKAKGQDDDDDDFDPKRPRKIVDPNAFDAAVGWQPSEHINFFKDLESGMTKHDRNREVEVEKKKEQEAWEKKVGILQYLGGSVSDREGAKPWYELAPGEAPKNDDKSLQRHELQKAHQADIDPLSSMNKLLRQQRKHDQRAKDREEARRPYVSSAYVPPTPTTAQRLPAASAGLSDADLALREARLRREQDERDRVAELLAAAVGGAASGGDEQPDERDRDKRKKHKKDKKEKKAKKDKRRDRE